jgi:hypothetical protein
MAEQPAFLSACEPPWVVFPFIDPDELPRHLKQGLAEPWFDQCWRPFWNGLSNERKQQYLDQWQATPQWRDAIGFVFGTLYELDAESDAVEMARWEARWADRRQAQGAKPSLWSRLFRSGK